VGAAESVAGGIMVLRSGKWMVLGQKSDLGGKGYLWNAESKVYKIGMGLVCGFHCKKIQN
jgi:hypothetical protein